MGFESKLKEENIRGYWRKGQFYVRLPNHKGKLKIKSINPEAFTRATEEDEFSVTKESTGGNMWTEYFETEDDLVTFVKEKLE